MDSVGSNPTGSALSLQPRTGVAVLGGVGAFRVALHIRLAVNASSLPIPHDRPLLHHRLRLFQHPPAHRTSGLSCMIPIVRGNLLPIGTVSADTHERPDRPRHPFSSSFLSHLPRPPALFPAFFYGVLHSCRCCPLTTRLMRVAGSGYGVPALNWRWQKLEQACRRSGVTSGPAGASFRRFLGGNIPKTERLTRA